MNFLQPILLAGLPLVALPIVIHLLNRQRHRTVAWGAMMFLLDAKRMTRGMARLRYFLIMAMRMLAIAGLIFAAARPMASGWVGLAVGGRADTTIIVLDRSASMEQQHPETRRSKRSTGLRKLSDLLETLGTHTKIVLLENTRNEPRTIESPAALLELPETSPTASIADIPAMLQSALDYIAVNQTGRTDIWVCSDLRASDWRVDDARWVAINEGFSALEGVRFSLLSYPQGPGNNVAVRVSNVSRRDNGQAAELVMDISLRREATDDVRDRIPLELVLDGARSMVHVDMVGAEHLLQGYTVPIDQATKQGWGRVELPGDTNPQDNHFYFVFSEPPEHHTLIVATDPFEAEPLRLASVSPASPALTYTATVTTPDRIGEQNWDEVSLALWLAPLPDGDDEQFLIEMERTQRPVIFFPPEENEQGECFGLGWGPWEQKDPDEPYQVLSWRGDADLLRPTRGGTALPLGQLRVYRYRPIEGNGVRLAQLNDERPLLVRADTTAPVYFCSTLPQAESSSLARDGVVLYVMVQRALALGAAALGNAQYYDAGSPISLQAADWQVTEMAGPDPTQDVISSERPFHPGAFQVEDKRIALNRPAEEDQASTLESSVVDRLFSGLDYRQVRDAPGNTSSLASEIWRTFLFAMSIALIVEAWLCLPDQGRLSAEVFVA